MGSEFLLKVILDESDLHRASVVKAGVNFVQDGLSVLNTFLHDVDIWTMD